MSRPSDEAPSARLSPGAEHLGRCLVAAGVWWLAVEAFFAWQAGRDARIIWSWIVAASCCFAARLRVSPSVCLLLGLCLAPLVLAVHGIELVLIVRHPPPATAAALAGRSWDNRSLAEVVDDVRRDRGSAVPSVQPKPVIVLEKGPLHTPAGEVLPLGGVSMEATVYCNEGGTWTIYDADERGFVNPAGLISSPSIDLALIGDSFTQGACVRPEESFAELVRGKHPSMVNVGMGGNGPLLELAGIREYLARLKPRRVLWFYFRNDLDDLNVEWKVPLLRRYLDPHFSQGLFDRQPTIDAALRTLVASQTRSARRWPGGLAAAGITRARTPVFIQDLIAAEQHSAASSLIRLDLVTSLLEWRAAARQPDLALFQEVLRCAKADVAAWGGELTFVYLPDLWSTGNTVVHHPLRAPVLAAAREVDLPILDVDEPFSREPDPVALRYSADSHDNPAGYRVVARIVNAYLDRADADTPSAGTARQTP